MEENRDITIDMNGGDSGSDYYENVTVTKNDDPLHPILEVTTAKGTLKLQNATIIFEPDVGCNQQNPPLQLAYNIVKKEVDKITFKYSLDNWVLKYAMRVDTIKNGCYMGGNCAVMLNMPYATYNIDQARELLISYCTELMSLLKVEYAVLYFDVRNAYGIKCIYSTKGELLQSDVEDYKLENTVSCTLEAGITTASTILQEHITNIAADHDARYYATPMYVYTGTYPSTAANSILSVPIVQNHAQFKDPNKFRHSVLKIIEDSKLIFTNLTII